MHLTQPSPALQRRDAYRVSLKSENASHVLLTRIQGAPPDKSNILDVSVKGVSFLLPEGFERPKVGERYLEVRVIMVPEPAPGQDNPKQALRRTPTPPSSKAPPPPKITEIRCDLLVRRVTDVSSEGDTKQRIGCALVNLSGDSERALQLFINAEQIRQRELRRA
jgi:c-di-GMP-binding flagellar brake protein YcgR